MAELPEPWNTAAEQAGVRQTYRGIGEKAGISHVTVRRLITEGRTSQATIRKVAQALSVDSATIHDWAELAVSEWGPWDPPKESQLLNPRARAALEELILAIAEGGQQGWLDAGGSEDDDPTGGLTIVPGPDDDPDYDPAGWGANERLAARDEGPHGKISKNTDDEGDEP